MGTGTSSKTTEDDVRNRLNSGDFQKVSPPSSPSITINASPTDENDMSYSGILVEKPGASTSASSASKATMSASFAADLSTPPVSNKSKSRTTITKAAAAQEQPRRIVKATPPSKVAANAETDGKENNNDAESPAVHHHPPSLASPIGANAATEMLEESIEKNHSKNKRMERVTNKQKSDREKLLQEKRRQKGGSSNADNKKVQANPFSRFLSAFSVDTNPTHKRKESNDAGDPTNKRLKFGYPASAAKADSGKSGAASEQDQTDPSSTAGSEDVDVDKEDNAPPFYQCPWFAAASAAAVAVLVFAIVRGSKKK